MRRNRHRAFRAGTRPGPAVHAPTAPLFETADERHVWLTRFGPSRRAPSLIEPAPASGLAQRPRRRGPAGRRAVRRRLPASPREPPAFRRGDRVVRRFAPALRLRGALASRARSPCWHAPAPCGHAPGRPTGQSGSPWPQSTALPPPSGARPARWRAALEKPHACPESRPVRPFELWGDTAGLTRAFRQRDAAAGFGCWPPHLPSGGPGRSCDRRSRPCWRPVPGVKSSATARPAGGGSTS